MITLHCQCKLLRAVALLAALLLHSASVFAERVSINSAHGQKGQGWLFGARGPEGVTDCWVLLPSHVAQPKGSGKAAAFQFTDSAGVTGHTSVPIVIADIPGAIDLTDGEDDLAFAKVEVGRAPGRCLSRLGLPAYSYDVVLRSLPELNFQKFQGASFDLFSMTVNRVWIDDRGGSVMSLKASDPESIGSQLMQGISGAIGEVIYRGQWYPFAMVTQLAEPGVANAIRFDAIKAVFNMIDITSTETDRVGDTGYELLSYRIRPQSNAAGPESLADPRVCWSASAADGDESVELVIRASDFLTGVRRLSIFHAAGCSDAPVRFSVDQRVPGSAQWVRERDCETVTGINSPSQCFMDLRMPRELRITFPTNKAISLSGIKLR